MFTHANQSAFVLASPIATGSPYLGSKQPASKLTSIFRHLCCFGLNLPVADHYFSTLSQGQRKS
jgi:hypothetical protein